MRGIPDGRPPARSYTDLRLELRDLDAEDDRFVLSLSGPAVGEQAPVKVALAYDEISDGLQDLEDRAVYEADELIRIGQALADRLLPQGEIRSAVADAIRAAGADDGVRLRLVIREPSLAQLPWEY